MIKPMTLVKWNYDALPLEWKKNNSNPYKDMAFIYLSEVTNMKDHAYCQCIETGKPYFLHSDELVEITQDEM